MLNVVLVSYEDWQEIFIDDESADRGHQLILSDVLEMLSGKGGFSFQEYVLSEDTPEEALNLIFSRDHEVRFSDREPYVRLYAE